MRNASIERCGRLDDVASQWFDGCCRYGFRGGLTRQRGLTRREEPTATSLPRAATGRRPSPGQCASARRDGARFGCRAAPGSSVVAAAARPCAAKPSTSGTSATTAATRTAVGLGISAAEQVWKPSSMRRYDARAARLAGRLEAAAQLSGVDGAVEVVPARSNPAFQSRRCRSTHRRPFSRSRRRSASRMCVCASMSRGMPPGLLVMM